MPISAGTGGRVTDDVEFQVSHHVRENDFVVAALFSWESGITMKSRRA